MKPLKLYYIDDDYIRYLQQYDDKVPYNKEKTRPFIGVVYTYEGKNFFAPLSSPKPKHLSMNEKAVDIFKIDKGILGVVNINNMLPTPMECLTEILPQIKDEKYKILLVKQITYLNDHKAELLTRVRQFQKLYRKGFLTNRVKERCCNFELLEEKCINYNRKHRSRNVMEDIEMK